MGERLLGRVGLVGDIGGTNARFAIARLAPGPGAAGQSGVASVRLDHVLSLPAAGYPSVEAAAQDYMARVGIARVDAAVAACAGPVVDRAVSFTNLSWITTELGFGAALRLPAVHLINDLAAVAWAAPALEPGSLRRVAHTGSLPMPAPALTEAGRTTRAILNAGTGCNASAFVHNESGAAVVVGEYGHVGYAPYDLLELEIWRVLYARFGRVSVERLLCGPGLLNLYLALCAIEGAVPTADSPSGVSHVAAAGDGLARRAIGRFCGIMGSVAGDVALCFGARGGLYLSGGVAALVLTEEHDTEFRRRFEDKGRFHTYLADIPTLLIQDTNVALLGAARAMAALLN